MIMTPSSHTLYNQCRILTAGLALVLASCQTAPTLQPDYIDTILGEMTTEEKIMLVVGAGNEEFTGYGNTKKIVPGAARAPPPRHACGPHAPATRTAPAPAPPRRSDLVPRAPPHPSHDLASRPPCSPTALPDCVSTRCARAKAAAIITQDSPSAPPWHVHGTQS